MPNGVIISLNKEFNTNAVTCGVFIIALRGMQTRSIAMRMLSVRLSVRPSVCLSVPLSNAWIVTKLKQDLSRFFYTIRKII